MKSYKKEKLKRRFDQGGHNINKNGVDDLKGLGEELKQWENNPDMDYNDIKADMELLPTKTLVKFLLKKASQKQLKKMVKEWEATKEHKRLYHLAKQLKKKKMVLQGFDTEKVLKEYKPRIWGIG